MTTTQQQQQDTVERLWYFSFGSNMDKHVLQNRRGIKPVDSVACRVPGYRITFDLRGLFYLEPAFANIEKVQDEKEQHNDEDGSGEEPHKENSLSELHGVAHLITPAEYLRIRYSEGGSGYEGYGYSDVDVKCIDYKGGEFVARALIAHNDTHKNQYLPSLRYLTLLRRGAREHKLDQKWIDYLDGLEAYEHSISSKVAVVMLAPLLLSVLAPFIVVVLLTTKMKKRTPLLMVQYLHHFQALLWVLHDWVLVHIFGSGKCNTGRAIKRAKE